MGTRDSASHMIHDFPTVNHDCSTSLRSSEHLLFCTTNARSQSQCTVNSTVQARILPVVTKWSISDANQWSVSNIQYSSNGTSRVLTVQKALFATPRSLSIHWACESKSGESATMHRRRFCSKLCGLGPACQQTHTHTPCWVGRPPASSALGSYSPSNLSFLHWSLARSWLGDESLCHHNYRTCTPQPAHACLVWNTTAVVVACTHAHPQQQRAIWWPRMIAAAAVSMWGIQTLPTVLGVAWFLCKSNPLVTIRRL